MALSGWDRPTSPYHAGERELHARLGRADRQDVIGRKVLRPYMPDQHRAFYETLPFLIAGSVDDAGWPWASVLFGAPGFISTPDGRTLRIESLPSGADPLGLALKPGTPVGLLGIEPPTRRRNRVNGVIDTAGDQAFSVRVVQSFGNCPQYIHARAPRPTTISAPTEPEPFDRLGDEAREIIQAADTFFVASANLGDDSQDVGGVDVSHRGGKPGFVRVDGDVLTIPDFSGNFFFNTLGNFLVNPKAGLLFIDYANGDLWQMTGTVEIIWEPTPEVAAFEGAERAWKFRLDHGRCFKGLTPFTWSEGDASPRSLATGGWG